MKQAKFNLMITILIMIALFSLLVLAVESYKVTLNSPTSGVWLEDSVVDFSFTPTGNFDYFDWCAVYTNATTDGSYTILANYSNIPNGTNYTRGQWINDSSMVDQYGWNVVCFVNGTETWGDSNNTFAVDGNHPVITLQTPTNWQYLNFQNFTLNYLAEDPTNTDVCLLYSNQSGWDINMTNTSYINGRVFTFNMTEMADNRYKWGVMCNQTSGKRVWSENWTFVLDTTAPCDIKITSPVNNSYSGDTTPEVVWNQTNDANFEKYVLYLYNDSAFSIPIQYQVFTTLTSLRTNATGLPINNRYYIKVAAYDLAGWSTNSTVIQYNLYNQSSTMITNNTNNTFLSDTTPDFFINITDANPQQCVLHLSNSSRQWVRINKTITGLTSGNLYNFTPTAMKDGNYTWNIECNGTNNLKTNLTDGLYEVVIDTFVNQVNITSVFHQKNSTNRRPMLNWTQSPDVNFLKYHVQARRVNDDSIEEEINITSQATNYYYFTNLTPYLTYNFSVVVYDKAGNSFKSSNTTTTDYYVDGICGTLYSGWNLCGAVWTTARNLSVIAEETGATFTAVWNNSHQWETCAYGVSNQYCGRTVNGTNDAINHVWIYVTSNTSWSNREWSASKATANWTLINVTNGWNLFGMTYRNGLTFEQLNASIRLGGLYAQNISLYSLWYNNYTNIVQTPYVTTSGWNTINKDTKVDYGQALWVYFNGTGAAKVNITGEW